MSNRRKRYARLFGILICLWFFGIPDASVSITTKTEESAVSPSTVRPEKMGQRPESGKPLLSLGPVIRLPVRPLSHPLAQQSRAEMESPASQRSGFDFPPELQTMMLYTAGTSLILFLLSAGMYLLLRRGVSKQTAVLPGEEDEVIPGVLMHMRKSHTTSDRVTPETVSMPVPEMNEAPERAWIPAGERTGARLAPVHEMADAEPGDTPIPYVHPEPRTPQIPEATIFGNTTAVKHLAHRGWTVQEIARELGWGQGEVSLALHLEARKAL